MTPIVLVPGLLCTAEVFAPQAAALRPYGAVTIANTLEGETMAEIASNILASAPPRFALGGISMGGYLCFEILRQAPQRVTKLALLDAAAHADTPEQTAQRKAMLAGARAGQFEALLTEALKAILHPAHQNDPVLAAINGRMGLTVGVDGSRSRHLSAKVWKLLKQPRAKGAIHHGDCRNRPGYRQERVSTLRS